MYKLIAVSPQLFGELQKTKDEVKKKYNRRIDFDEAIKVYALTHNHKTPVIVLNRRGRRKYCGFGVMDVDLGDYGLSGCSVDFLFE